MPANEEDDSELSDSLQALLDVAGEDYLAPALLKACPKRYSVENAASWVNFDKFALFVANLSQIGTEPRTPSNNPSICSESGSSSPCERNQSGDPLLATPSKRSRSSSIPSIDSPTIHLSQKLTKPLPKRQKRAEKAEEIAITRELSVEEVKILTEPPENWDIPAPGEKTIAYLLDLSNSRFEYKNEVGEFITMSRIIKNQCTDGWEGGSGGSKKNSVKVPILDNLPCMRAIHNCRGTFLCSEADPKLWQDYQRFRFDFEPFKKLHRLNQENNSREQDTPLGIAAAFYHSVKYLECRANSGKCNGHSVLRRLQKISSQGKNFIVGCSAWTFEDKKQDHIYCAIPITVREDILQELFSTGGQTTSPDTEEYIGPCGFLVPPRTGFRQKRCPHVHFRNKQQITGTIERRKCPASIVILTPTDESIRKAIVVPLTEPHNHPSFKPEKLTIPAKESWRKAVIATGAFGSTVTSVDKASSTKVILGSDTKTRQFQCLTNSRYKSTILGKAKRQDYPYGLQIEGVVHLYQTEVSKLSIKDRYIHAILTEPCADTNEPIYVIVTMIPSLANFVHAANATLHDNTYKRVFGSFNEWEVVIWDSRLNKRVAISRVYCNRENRQAFRLIWRGWMEAIRTVTEKPLAIKALHGDGRHVAFLMDGCAAQIQGLGDYLLTLNDPAKSQITTSDAEEIVQYVIRTCDVHCNRNLDALASVCSHDDMDRIRRFRFLSTQEEMDGFIAFCQNHPQAKVKDWIANKLKYPWYLPSLCRHFSKILPKDWDLTPADTNLNETSHPATNRATGINLPLLEAIQSARKYDELVAFDISKAEETCVDAHLRNTLTQRFTSNGQRTNKRLKRADEERKVRTELCSLDDILEIAEKEKKAAIENVKTLKAKKREVSGGKKRKHRTAGTLKPMPAFDIPIANGKENSLVSTSNMYIGTSTIPSTPAPFSTPPLSTYNTHLAMLEHNNPNLPNNGNFLADPFAIPSYSSLCPSTATYNPTTATGNFFAFDPYNSHSSADPSNNLSAGLFSEFGWTGSHNIGGA